MYQKKDGRGHTRPYFFWYDNDKDLKVCFLVSPVKCQFYFHLLFQVSVLSLYSVAIDNPERATSLHLCISGCHGNLEDDDVSTIEQKCSFLGTSAILFLMDITAERKCDEVMTSCAVTCGIHVVGM